VVQDAKVETDLRGIPHLVKNQRDAPNFLHAALDETACAPFFKERRMRRVEPTNLHRKSGNVGHPGSVSGQETPHSKTHAILYSGQRNDMVNRKYQQDHGDHQ
jgi:hypothetical protein